MLLRQTVWILCFALLLPTSATAGKPDEWTDAEVNMAAPYCIDTMGFRYGDAYHNTSPRASHWVSIMGKSFWAMHHYCWALVNLNRAQRASMPSSQRRALRESAVNDMRYVIHNSNPDFIMLPEVFTTLGNTYLLLRNERFAEKAFKSAIAARADYWPPYARWAEHLIIRGNSREEARTVVRDGLTHAPGSKTLLALWKELGGGPLPTPVEKPAPPAEAQQESPEPPADPQPAAGQ
jgi:hypothetical protein